MAVKRYKYSVTNKKYAAKGVVSSVCGGISAGVLCAASLCSLAFLLPYYYILRIKKEWLGKKFAFTIQPMGD